MVSFFRVFMIYSDNMPCTSKNCDSWLKVRRRPANWKPDRAFKYQYAVWYVCGHGHSHFNDCDKRYPEQSKPKGLFGDIVDVPSVQPVLIKQPKPKPTTYESRRRKCWICRHRFLSENGNETCPECISKRGEQKVKAEPKPLLTKTPMTASEKARANSTKRPWLQRLRAAVPRTTFAADMKDPEFVGIYRKIIQGKLDNANNPEVLNIALLNELNKIGGTRSKKARRR